MTEISPCPYCGNQPKQYSEKYDVQYCNTVGCIMRDLSLLSGEWNALCADIEKGRRYDAMTAHVKYPCGVKGCPFCADIKANKDAILQRDEAVRLLLRPSHLCTYDSCQTCKKIRNLLASDWAKDILKQGEK